LALKDEASDHLQMQKFDHALNVLKQMDIRIPMAHACDSIGAMVYKDAPYPLVRLGAALYGYCSREIPFKLRPVMTLKTQISHVKDIEIGEAVSYDGLFIAERKTRIATLPIGYADGIPRHLSNGGKVLVNGKYAPIVGLICMDQCMIDVTDLDEINLGDTVIFFGEEVPLLEISKRSGTNRNEILSRISLRVPRIIKFADGSEKVVDYLLGEEVRD